MTTALLVIIYLAFISLGLPDSMFGAAWPQMYIDFGVPISAQGIVSIITVGGTVLSSLLASRAIGKFGTGKVTAVSVALTAIALVGISFSNSIIFAALMTIPLGIGAGAVDTGLNNYVAKNYKAKHMNWLHCFWGVGVTASPLILGFAIGNFGTWRVGYQIIAATQGILALILIFSLPLWKKCAKKFEVEKAVDVLPLKEEFVGNKEAIRRRGVFLAMIAFFLYCSVEFTVSNWGSSYLVKSLGLSVEKSATLISLYFFGIAVGRGVAGFLAIKLKSKTLIRIGSALLLVGIFALLFGGANIQIGGLFMIGFGCAPIFPCMIQLTPSRFGAKYSQAVIGLQMACAYVSGTVISPLFGVLGNAYSMDILPIYILVLAVLMFLAIESTDILLARKSEKA